MTTPFEVISLLAAAVAVVVGIVVLRRRNTLPLAGPMAVVMAGASWWAVSGYLIMTAPTAAVLARWSASLVASSSLLVVGALWHAMVLSGRGGRMTRRLAVQLAVEPAVMVLLAVTDPLHHLVIREVVPLDGGGMATVQGPAMWAHVAYSYIVFMAAAFLVVSAATTAVTGQRWRYGLILAATSMPVVGTVITVSRTGRAPFVDITSALMLVTVAIWLWVERYASGMHRVPVTVRQVLEVLGDAVLVLDPAGRVVQANPAAQAMLGPSGLGLVDTVDGAHWSELVDEAHLADVRAGRTVTYPDGHVLDVRSVPLAASGGGGAGVVVVVRDVTAVEALRAELAEQAVRDGLTGLHNRRHLHAVLDVLVSASLAGGSPLTAVMIDLDHFKTVNDSHGHAAGDAVLVAVARELTAAVRADDVVVRMGGEEFCVVLPGVAPAEVLHRFDAWRVRIAGLDLVRGVRVTVSAGVAGLGHGGSSDALLRSADDALYAAKVAGRDRVLLGDLATTT